MSIAPNPLNDISRVYLEQIAESAVPGKPAEKVGALTNIDIPKSERDAARERLLAKAKAKRKKITESHFKVGDEVICKASGMEGEVVKVDPEEKGKYYTVKREDGKKVKYAPNELKLEDEDEKGKVKRWWDDDGDGIGYEEGEVSGKFKRKKKMKEGFSNWRQDLSEVMGGIESDKKIKEKKIKNKVKINPKLGEAVEELGGTLLEMVSIDEEYLYETVDIASNYFYEQGLNENGVEILIEELGDEEFVSFVHDIREEITLFEARAGGVKVEPVTKTGKQVGSLKGGARTSAIKRLRKEKQARREAEARTSSEKPSGMKAALQRQSAMSSAKKQQKPTPQGRTRRGALDRIAGAVLSGMERHRKATAAASKMAKQTGETLRKAAPVARKAASEFGKGFTSGVKTAGKAAKDVKKTVSKEELELQEKPFDVYDTRRDLYLAKGLKTRKGARRRSDKEDEKYGAITTKVIPTGDDRPEIKYKTKKEEYEIDEKMNLKTAEMGEVIKDFQKSDAPQFKGKTKEERRQMAIAAKLTAERGGKKLGEQQEDDGNQSKEKQLLAKKKQMMQKQYMLDKMRLQAQQQGKLPIGHRTEETAVDLVTNMIRKQQGGTYGELKKQGKLSKPKSKKPSNLKPTDMTKATDPRPGSRYRGD
jgi:hypothetical protein